MNKYFMAGVIIVLMALAIKEAIDIWKDKRKQKKAKESIKRR